MNVTCAIWISVSATSTARILTKQTHEEPSSSKPSCKTHFEGADLRNAYFVDADLRNAHFEGADLRGAIFTFADLRGASFYDTLSDDHTTWDNAQFGNLEPEPLPERHTDGIEKIDFSEIEHLLYKQDAPVLYEDEAEDEYDYEEA